MTKSITTIRNIETEIILEDDENGSEHNVAISQSEYESQLNKITREAKKKIQKSQTLNISQRHELRRMKTLLEEKDLKYKNLES